MFQLPKVLTEAEVVEAEAELKALQRHALEERINGWGHEMLLSRALSDLLVLLLHHHDKTTMLRLYGSDYPTGPPHASLRLIVTLLTTDIRR
jgi:hypothetical protein